jgi:hypothetical protein
MVENINTDYLALPLITGEAINPIINMTIPTEIQRIVSPLTGDEINIQIPVRQEPPLSTNPTMSQIPTVIPEINSDDYIRVRSTRIPNPEIHIQFDDILDRTTYFNPVFTPNIEGVMENNYTLIIESGDIREVYRNLPYNNHEETLRQRYSLYRNRVRSAERNFMDSVTVNGRELALVR